MTTLYFIRHGQKEKHIGDPPLTPKGIEQAHNTGIFLAQFPISRIISSPALRTQQTAQKIQEHISVPIQINPLLKERANWGDHSKQSFNDFLKTWTRATWQRNFAPPGGDSSQKTGDRIAKVIANLPLVEQNQHIVFVTHGGAIADFLRNTFSDEKLGRLITEFPAGKDFAVPECSVTILHKDGSDFELIELASGAHLTSF